MKFTEREICVKALIESGHTTAEIAAKLELSTLSVYKLRGRLNMKLGVVSRDKMLETGKLARLRMGSGMTTEAMKARAERNMKILGYMGAAASDTKAAYRSYPKYPDAVLDLLGNARKSIDLAIHELRKT